MVPAIILALLLLPLGWVLMPLCFFCGNSGPQKTYLLIGSLRVLCKILLILSICNVILATQIGHEQILDFGEWFPMGGNILPLACKADLLGASYLCLSDFLLVLIVHFSSSYLRGDLGFTRFFVCLGVARFGMGLVCLGATIDVLLIGWELVGLSSVLLIAFFRTNSRAAMNSVSTWVCYKICDIALIVAVGLIHKLGHHVFWDNLHIRLYETTSSSHEFQLIAVLLILSTLAKSGQFPFHWWVARAMEGPSPSSALFYGALSLHLGPFLLLRTYPIWSPSTWLCVLIGAIGAISAIVATISGRVNSNVKTQLANASVCQVGLIYVELALGWNQLALYHLFTHALLRSWQFLRANSLLQDFQNNPFFIEGQKKDSLLSLTRWMPACVEKAAFLWGQQGFFVEQAMHQLAFHYLSLVKRIYKIKKKIFLQGLFLIPNQRPKKIFLFLLRFGLLQTALLLLCGGLNIHTLYYSKICLIFPIFAVVFASFSLVTVRWSSCLYYCAQSFTQLYTVLLLSEASRCRWVGAGCMTIQILLLLYLQNIDVQLIRARHAVSIFLHTHFSGLKNNPGFIFMLLLLFLGAPGSLAYIGQDAVGHIILENNGISMQVVTLLASSICFISIYQRYLILYHGTKPIE
jgi:NADH-quinone oxidoreductase subunit L